MIESSVSVCTCSRKSQCSTMPASSTSRRKVISPQRPRNFGSPQGVDEIVCFLLEGRLTDSHGLELFAYSAVSLTACFFEFVDLLL